jgi:integrase
MEQSVNEFHELYLSRSKLRPASVDIKRRACKYFVEWFGDIAVGKVTSILAEDYRTMLDRNLGGAVSVNGYLNNFRPFWSWLFRHGYISANPFASIEPLPIEEPPQRETFSPDELSRLLRVSDGLWTIRICLGLLGARRGEMLAVQVHDIHIDEDPPHILLAYKAASGRTLPWAAKGRRRRLIGLPDRMGFPGLIIPLRELILQRMEGRAPDDYLCLDSRRHERLLTKQQSGSLTHCDLRDLAGNFPRSFVSLQRAAGLRKPKRFHELRAAFTTAMIDELGLSRAADLVSHTSVEQTRKYDRKSKLELVAQAVRIAATTYVSKVS